MTLRFKLEASSGTLTEMSEEMAEAPTYAIKADAINMVMRLSSPQHTLTNAKDNSGEIALTTKSISNKVSQRELPTPVPKVRYDKKSTLGEGGTGFVFSMRDHNIGREVAVKILKPGHSEADRIAFIREGMLAGRLEHPNIVPVYDMDVDEGGCVYLTMKNIKGTTLKSYTMEANSNQLFEELILIILKVCDGLNYAHSLGLVHQDIKPENIMVGEFGEVFLIDWGAASPSDSVERQLSPVYMSPQQADGIPPQISDDIYCLGASLFHILFKRFPTNGKDLNELWENKVKGHIDLPTEDEKADVPGPLSAIILKAMETDPDKRYRSVAEFAADLKSYQAGFITSAEDATLWRLFKLFVRRRKREICIALIGLCVLGAIGGIQYAKDQEAQRARLRESADYCAEGRRQAGAATETSDVSERQKYLVASEQAYRRSLFIQPDNEEAKEGFRDASLLYFQLALDRKNWWQAEEKLRQAHGWGLSDSQHASRLAELARARTERERLILKRVGEIMADAGTLQRSMPHEVARQELITLKSPQTVDALISYLAPDYRANAQEEALVDNQIYLAIDALGWLGDRRAVEHLAPFLKRTFNGSENPHLVRQAAFIAFCLLDGDNLETFRLLEEQIMVEPLNVMSNLYIGVSSYYEPLMRKMAKKEALPPGNAQPDNPGNGNEKPKDEEPKDEEPKDEEPKDEEPKDEEPKDEEPNVGKRNERPSWYTPVIENLERKAFRLIKTGRYEEALTVYNELESKTGPKAAVLHNKALAHFSMKSYDLALKTIDRGIEIGPAKEKYYRLKVRILIKLWRLHEAEKTADVTLETASDYLPGYLSRGVVRWHLGDWQASQRDFAVAAGKGNQHQSIMYSMVDIYSKKGFGSKAIEVSDIVLKTYPNSMGVYVVRAGNLLKSGREDEAMADYDKVLAIDPTNHAVYYFRSKYNQAKADMTEALKEIKKAYTLKPDSLTYLLQYCALLEHLKMDSSPQVTKLDKRLGEEKRIAEVQKIVQRLEKYQQQSALIGQQLTNATDLQSRASYLLELGKHEEAQRDLKAIIAMNHSTEDSLTAYRKLAASTQYLGAWKDRLEYFREWAASPDDINLEGQYKYAVELLYSPDPLLRQPKEALSIMTKAVERVKNADNIGTKLQAAIYLSLAKAQYENGLASDAVANGKTAVSMAEDNPKSLLYQGALYWFDKFQATADNQ